MRVRRVVSSQLRVAESKVEEGSAIVADLGADRVDLKELVMALEAEFGIDIPDHEEKRFVTVADCVRYVDRLNE